MRITREELDRYAKTVEGLSSEAKDFIESSLTLFREAEPDATTAEIRAFTIETIRAAMGRYGDASARSAANLYDEVMQREGVDVDSAAIYDGPNDGEIIGTVHRLAGRLNTDSPDMDGFIKQASKFAADEIRRAARKTIAQNVQRDHKTKRGKNVRFARVPQRAVPCPWCVMLASRGFDYLSEDSAAAGNHHNCTCIVIPGVNGNTKVEGYDVSAYKRWDRRLRCCETVHEYFYTGNKSEVKDKADEYEGALRHCKGLYDSGIKDVESYREKYASFVKERGNGNIDIDDFTFIEGKELQLAEWFADAGHVVHFRNADDNKGDTSDVTIDKDKWEFKRIESSRISKLTGRVTGRLDTQGPNFVVDLSASDMNLDHARTKIAQLLDDPRIEMVMLVAQGSVTLYTK